MAKELRQDIVGGRRHANRQSGVLLLDPAQEPQLTQVVPKGVLNVNAQDTKVREKGLHVLELECWLLTI